MNNDINLNERNTLAIEKLAVATESIALKLDLLAQLLSHQNVNFSNSFQSFATANYKSPNPTSLEDELFIATTDIYIDETIRKNKENLQRKSARKVSQNLIPMQINFLSNYLPNYIIEEINSGILMISKDEQPKALIRIFTDLGFHRGDNWRLSISEIVETAVSKDISLENIFVIVLSSENSLDNKHISEILNRQIKVKEILDLANYDVLKNFWYSYIHSFSDLLPNVHEQLHILAGALHPNVVSDQVVHNNESFDLQDYKWLSTPLSKIINHISKL